MIIKSEFSPTSVLSDPDAERRVHGGPEEGRQGVGEEVDDEEHERCEEIGASEASDRRARRVDVTDAHIQRTCHATARFWCGLYPV